MLIVSPFRANLVLVMFLAFWNFFFSSWSIWLCIGPAWAIFSWSVRELLFIIALCSCLSCMNFLVNLGIVTLAVLITSSLILSLKALKRIWGLFVCECVGDNIIFLFSSSANLRISFLKALSFSRKSGSFQRPWPCHGMDGSDILKLVRQWSDSIGELFISQSDAVLKMGEVV